MSVITEEFSIHFAHILLIICVLMVIIGIIVLRRITKKEHTRNEELPYKEGLSHLGFAMTAVGAVFFCLSILGLLISSVPIIPKKTESIDYDRTASVIESQYDIKNARPNFTNPGIFVSTKSIVRHFCEPMSERSPLWTGVNDGREIEFRVSIDQCHSDNPKINIVITDGPGSITPDGIRRDDR